MTLKRTCTDVATVLGDQYNTALTIFFVPYIVFEIPSNILLKRFKPHVWLSGCMFLFGLVTLCQGLVQNYSGLLATRFFLGLAETGMFPGSFYLIGMWYKRSEAQKRYSFFFGSTSLAGAFGGLLASAIGKMNGMRGYLGWRWIFILGKQLPTYFVEGTRLIQAPEGVLSCVVSFAFFFLIPNFPEDASWCGLPFHSLFSTVRTLSSSLIKGIKIGSPPKSVPTFAPALIKTKAAPLPSAP